MQHINKVRDTDWFSMHKQTSKATKQVGTANDPWEQLDAIMASEAEPTGPEWFTQEQFEARYKIHRKVAWERLKRLTEQGVLESWVGRIASIQRRGRKYRPKPAS